MAKLKYIAASLGVLGLITIYAMEFSWFDRTLGVRRLVFWSMAAGALAGLVLGWRFRQTADSLTEKIQLFVFFTIICMIFAPLTGSLSNRLLSPHPLRDQPVTVAEEQPFLSEPYGLIKGEKPKTSGYYTFFYYDGKLRRIKNREAVFSGLQRGDTGMLRMRKGLWGPEVVAKGQGGD